MQILAMRAMGHEPLPDHSSRRSLVCSSSALMVAWMIGMQTSSATAQVPSPAALQAREAATAEQKRASDERAAKVITSVFACSGSLTEVVVSLVHADTHCDSIEAAVLATPAAAAKCLRSRLRSAATGSEEVCCFIFSSK